MLEDTSVGMFLSWATKVILEQWGLCDLLHWNCYFMLVNYVTVLLLADRRIGTRHVMNATVPTV